MNGWKCQNLFCLMERSKMRSSSGTMKSTYKLENQEWTPLVGLKVIYAHTCWSGNNIISKHKYHEDSYPHSNKPTRVISGLKM